MRYAGTKPRAADIQDRRKLNIAENQYHGHQLV